jgi:hypothetical protein
MDLTYDDVQAILKIIDSSAIEELHANTRLRSAAQPRAIRTANGASQSANALHDNGGSPSRCSD